jgi:hypothetical protein
LPLKTWKRHSKVAYNRPPFFFQYCQPAQNQPKSHFLFHKNVSLRDFYMMTLVPTLGNHCTVQGIKETFGRFPVVCWSKFFTYGTKTRPNLSTYSRNSGNYNGTIIFEIDIMKTYYPINWNLCQTWLFHKCFGCFGFLWKLLRATADCTRKKVTFWFWQWQKCEFWIDWVILFYDINFKNNGTFVISRFSTVCG